MKRIIRDRHLTPAEAAEYEKVRKQVDAEWPEIEARIRSQLTTSSQSPKNWTEGEHVQRQPIEPRGIWRRIWASILGFFRGNLGTDRAEQERQIP